MVLWYSDESLIPTPGKPKDKTKIRKATGKAVKGLKKERLQAGATARVRGQVVTVTVATGKRLEARRIQTGSAQQSAKRHDDVQKDMKAERAVQVHQIG